MNARDTVLRLANTLVTHYRPGTTTINGYGIASTAADTLISTGTKAVVFSPARQNELQKLKIGEHLRRSATITMATEIRIGDKIVTEDSTEYRIHGVTTSGNYGFWTAVGLRKVEQ